MPANTTAGKELNMLFSMSILERPSLWGLYVLASAGPAFAGPMVGGGDLETLSVARFDGKNLTTDFVESLATREGDTLVEWSPCAGHTPGELSNEDDCVTLLVGEGSSLSDIRLSADACLAGEACYAGFTIDFRTDTTYDIDATDMSLNADFYSRREVARANGDVTQDLVLYGTTDGASGSSGYWLTFYDSEGAVVSGESVDVYGYVACEQKAELGAQAADGAVRVAYSPFVFVQAVACTMAQTLDTANGSVGASSGGMEGAAEGNIEADTLVLAECEDFNILYNTRAGWGLYHATKTYADIISKCDGTCPSNVSFFHEISTSDGTECYKIDADCQEEQGECICKGSATETDASNCD